MHDDVLLQHSYHHFSLHQRLQPRGITSIMKTLLREVVLRDMTHKHRRAPSWLYLGRGLFRAVHPVIQFHETSSLHLFDQWTAKSPLLLSHSAANQCLQSFYAPCSPKALILYLSLLGTCLMSCGYTGLTIVLRSPWCHASQCRPFRGPQVWRR